MILHCLDWVLLKNSSNTNEIRLEPLSHKEGNYL